MLWTPKKIRICCVLAVVISAVTAAPQKQDRPNIVFILADDLGWSDVSFHGSDQIQTPNIDSLAYTGVVLQRYYSDITCSPTRTALLTGKYAIRLGMYGLPLFNGEDRGIPLEEKLLPQYLKELGYATHLVGKWHVGMSREGYLPRARGFDTHYGFRGGSIDYYTHNHVEKYADGTIYAGLDFFDNDVPLYIKDRHSYSTHLFTERAVKIIHSHNGSTPLFLHICHNAPHSANLGNQLQPPSTVVRNSHIANSDRRLYAEIVTDLDKSVGLIIKALAEVNMLDNTIIVFTSDNGAPTVGASNNWGVNLPLRGIKETPWDAAVRVPAIIWHSSLKTRVWDGLLHVSDWLPTLLAAAGAHVNAHIDGINQWDAITLNRESKRNEVFVTYENNGNVPFVAIIVGDYKLVVGNVSNLPNYYYGEIFLANKESPPDYFKSLRSSHTGRLFESMGYFFEPQTVQAIRSATLLRQSDPKSDKFPCIPTPMKGCLFNLRRDPFERHDLWSQSQDIVAVLSQRMYQIIQTKRPKQPFSENPEANPERFNYTWNPWLPDHHFRFPYR